MEAPLRREEIRILEMILIMMKMIGDGELRVMIITVEGGLVALIHDDYSHIE